MVILADYVYWAEHQQELKEWCTKNHCQYQGMTVTICDSETLALFCLRWA